MDSLALLIRFTPVQSGQRPLYRLSPLLPPLLLPGLGSRRFGLVAGCAEVVGGGGGGVAEERGGGVGAAPHLLRFHWTVKYLVRLEISFQVVDMGD